MMKSRFRELLLISIVYFSSQFFLLIASGNWWDDWLFVYRDWDDMYRQFRESSLPLEALVNWCLWQLPDGAYRILVFLNYYCGAILIYHILHKIDLFCAEDCFWIVILYTAMPINDARITWICYGYSLGLLSFWGAFYFATIWKNWEGKKSILGRAILWLLLLFSYNTESIMLMTLLVFFYLVYERLKKEWKQKRKKDYRIVVKNMLIYADLIALPIVFYFGKHFLFPADAGKYYRHNYVDWAALPMLIVKSPFYMLITFAAEFGYNAMLLVMKKNIYIIISMIGGSLIILLSFLLYHRKKRVIKTNDFSPIESYDEDTIFCNDRSRKKVVILLIVSIFVYYIGLFPYYIRNHGYVATREYDGRHSLLLGLGSAMIVYYISRWLVRNNIWKAVCMIVVWFGVIFFNVKYLDWQEDYYQTLRFQHGIISNVDIMNNDMFYCIFEHPGINIENYRLAGNAFLATGDRKRRFDLSNEILLDKEIDGIILVNNASIEYGTIVLEKWYELFDSVKFCEWIDETTDVVYVPLSREESKDYFDQMAKGELSKTDIVNKYRN